ncbi:hypothetical protein D3C72_2315730 [compost metagenome]
MPGDGVEIEIGEIQPLRATVGDPLASQIAVQIHLPKPNSVRSGISRFNRRHAADMAHV